MMPKHSSRAPWGRRLTAVVAVSLLTLGACSDSGGGGGRSIEYVEVVTLPNNLATTNLIPGTSRQLLAAPSNSDSNFVDVGVTWSSSNSAVAAVSSTGLVTTSQGGGSATISAVAGGVTGTMEFAVRYPVASIALAPAAVDLRREGLQQLTATLTDANGGTVTDRTVTWSSSDETVATVSATGLVAATEDAVNASSAIITATSANALDGGNVITATRTVTVNGDAVVSSVALTGGSGLVGTPSDLQLSAEALSGLGNTIVTPIAFTSSAPAIATVDATGLVSFAGDTGAVTITATATGAGDAGADVAATAVFRSLEALTSGVPMTGVGAASGADDWYAFYVPAAATSFTITLTGPNGDGDLYLYRPGSASITHQSFNAATAESITVDRAGTAAYTGWWLVRMNAWDGDTDVSDAVITATHNAP